MVPVLIGLVIAFVMVAIWGSRGRRDCRWRLDRSRAEPGRDFYRCAACGAERQVPKGRPPRRCALETDA
ncbi:MAG: hypothetical protein D6811_04420 [Alphaproteobacteria bacterium]|nr:MAG: hypothetical protein D6811_04420 [Alphaproteobacteria bacterium]